MNMTLNVAGFLGFGLLLALSVTAAIIVVVVIVSRSKKADPHNKLSMNPIPNENDIADTQPENTETICEQPQTLGEIIKSHRIRCNMTQEYVAEALNVTRQAVSKWETDSSDPSTSNLLALAKLYGISAAELLKDL